VVCKSHTQCDRLSQEQLGIKFLKAFFQISTKTLFTSLHCIGGWSGCVRAKCGSGGLDTRHVHCQRLSDNVVVDDRSCDVSTRPSCSRTCFRFCEHHRFTYHWVVGPWSECHTTGPCQHGLRAGRCGLIYSSPISSVFIMLTRIRSVERGICPIAAVCTVLLSRYYASNVSGHDLDLSRSRDVIDHV